MGDLVRGRIFAVLRFALHPYDTIAVVEGEWVGAEQEPNRARGRGEVPRRGEERRDESTADA